MAKELRELTEHLQGRDSEEGQLARITHLPWQNLESKDLESRVRKEVFSLSKEYDMLTQPKSNLEFKFNFDMDSYAFVSIAMLKHDKNLDETRDQMVPDEVDEEGITVGIQRMLFAGSRTVFGIHYCSLGLWCVCV